MPGSNIAFQVLGTGEYILASAGAGGTQLHPRQHPDQFLAGIFFEMSGRPLYRLAAELLPGNQISASLPVALHHGIANGRVHNADVVALIGSGAGVSFGGVILRY